MLSAEERDRVQAQAAEIAAEQLSGSGAGARCKNGARVHVSRRFKGESGPYVMALARELLGLPGGRWFSYCLARYHPAAFRSLDDAQVEAFGQGLAGQELVDSYARILAGPAWLRGLVADSLVRCWARSEDRWWRRAALVSTVALNVRGDGGTGDAPRTLAICRLLAGDRDAMVASALSWALRALTAHDPLAVCAFVAEHEVELAPQVRQEGARDLQSSLASA